MGPPVRKGPPPTPPLRAPAPQPGAVALRGEVSGGGVVERHDRLRLFIAVELPDAVRAAIDDVLKMLRREAPGGAARWVRPEGVHLTLKFLGPVPADRVEEVRGALNEAAHGLAPFELQPERLGAFHGSRGGALEFRRGREVYAHNLTVIWVGLGGNVEMLGELARRVEERVAPLGYPTEKRPFFPHLTLARVAKTAGRAEREALFHAIEPYLSASSRTGRFREGAFPTFPAFPVRDVHLVQSLLRPSGAEYRSVAVAALGGGLG